MDQLKKFFPFSFKKKPTVSSLVITVILHAVASIVVAVVLGLLGWLLEPVAFLFSLLATLVDLYITAGIVFTFLHYFKVFKVSGDGSADVIEAPKENDDSTEA